MANPFLYSILGAKKYLIKILKISKTLNKIRFYHKTIGYKIQGKINRILNIKINHNNISDIKVDKLPRNINHFVWLERTQEVTERIEISATYFEQRMNLCLKHEDRSFLDFDGGLGVGL